VGNIRSLKYTFALFLLISLVFQINVAGDDIAVEITQTGQIVPNYNTSIYMKSQNITVHLSKIVHEKTEYTLKNPTNSSQNMTSLLPFSGDRDDRANYRDFPKPYNLILNVDGIDTNYNWTTFEWSSQLFDAIIFNVSFDPHEEISIIAEYDRSYKGTSSGWRFEYLTMTGTLWNHSIGYAMFEFYIDNDMEKYTVAGMDGYNVSLEGNTTIVSKIYYDWTPTENIRIFIEHERSSYNPFFWNYTFPFLVVVAIVGSAYHIRSFPIKRR
jgi:hypothetical protein